MPYQVKPIAGGYIVVNTQTGKQQSAKPLSRTRAQAQMRALYAAERGAIKVQADADAGKPAASGGGVHARAGQSIRGNLFRGTGGRFQAGPGAVLQDRLAKLRAAMPKGKLRAVGKKGKGKGKGKGAKPKQTPEQRAAAKEQQRLQNRTNALGKLSSKPNDAAMAALDAMAKGDAVDPDMAGAIADETGLAERHADGSITLSAAGKKLLSALDKGDAAGAADAIAGAGDKQAKQDARTQAKETRQQAAAQRKAEREKAKAAKKKKVAGGAKKPTEKAPSPKQTDQDKADTRAKNRETVTKKMMSNDTGITTHGFTALATLSDTGEMDKDVAGVLEGMGLVDRDTDGKPRVSAQGRKLLRAADKGDYDGALDAIAAGGDRAAGRKQKAKEKADKEKERTAADTAKEKRQTAQKERQTDRGLRLLSRGGKVGDSQLLDMEDEGLIAFDKQNKPQLTDKGKKRLQARQQPTAASTKG